MLGGSGSRREQMLVQPQLEYQELAQVCSRFSETLEPRLNFVRFVRHKKSARDLFRVISNSYLEILVSTK